MTKANQVQIKWSGVDLRKLYWDEVKTPREIGESFGVTGKAVEGALVRHGIPRRTPQNPIHKRENHYRWKGGRIYEGKYIIVKLEPSDFFYPTARPNGYVLEHRLVAARALGRNLHLWEIVHHKKGYAKDDNRYPETLQVVTDARHAQITVLENRILKLEQQVLLLEGENEKLKIK